MSATNVSTEPILSRRRVPVQEMDSVTIRFAGDSGDGMQLA
jgi:hypothetical protein